ncbi:hypothetical protein ACP70R_003270 [Stipagrostis hirtigluma subsp. patula]
MKSQVRTVLLSTVPVLFGGKTRSFSTLRGAASTLQRRRPPLLHPAGRAALSTLPSSTAPAASDAAPLDSSAPKPAAASQVPVPTTVSRCSPEKTQGRHVFEIAGYSLLKGLGVGNFVQSGTFTVGGYDWCLQYYPDGSSNSDSDSDSDYGYGYSDDSDEDDEDDRGYVSVFLALMTKDANVRALYDLRLVNPATGLLSPECSSKDKPMVFDGHGSSRGIGKFKQKSDLEASEYLRDDCLKIQCDITVIMGTPVSQSETMCDIQVPPSDLLDDLRKFLEAEKRADVKFKVKGEVFNAHKFVLAMRSPVLEEELYGPPVLEAELYRPLDESNCRCITINDMEPAVFEALLHFIYTDSLPSMDDLSGDETEEMIKHLLVAADKYAMQRMKLLCESILSKRLKIESVATTLALAEKLNCSQLKDACISFINSSDRMDAVVASQGYEQLKKACPSAIVELWEKSAKSRKI